MNTQIDTELQPKKTIYYLFKQLSSKQKRKIIIRLSLGILVFLLFETWLFFEDLPRREYCKSLGGEYAGESFVFYYKNHQSGCYIDKDTWKYQSVEIKNWNDTAKNFMNIYVGSVFWPCYVYPSEEETPSCLSD